MTVSEYQLGMRMPCARCGTVLLISEDNTESPGGGAADAVEYEPFAAKTTAEHAMAAAVPFEYEPPTNRDAPKGRVGEHCARCDAVIRGDWDRYETDRGVWCNRCVNRAPDPNEEPVQVLRRGAAQAAGMAAGPGPEFVLPPSVDDRPRTAEDFVRETEARARQAKPEEERRDRPALLRKYPRATQWAMWTMIVGVLGATVYAFVLAPETGTQVVEADTSMAEAIARVPFGVRIALAVGFWLLSAVGPLYLTLYISDKLPTGAIITDVLHVTFIAVLVSVLGVFLGLVPFLGGIVFLFMGFLILWSTYNMNLSDFIIWFLMAFVLRVFLLGPLESQILYGMGRAMGTG